MPESKPTVKRARFMESANGAGMRGRLMKQVLAALLVIIPLSGCGMVKKEKDGEASSGKESQVAAPSGGATAGKAVEEERIVAPVEAQKPERGAVHAYFETTTRVTAERQVQVIPEGMGRCEAVFVDEGDEVREGDVLAELDKKDAEAQLRQSGVQVQKTKVDLDRTKRLVEEELAAPAEYDAARFAHESAVATQAMHELQLRNLTVRAPISGLVTKRHIQAGMMVSSGTPAFEIVDPDSFFLNIMPPEKELPRLSIGQEAHVSVDALEGEAFTARITRINPSVDQMTGTVKVRLEMSLDVRRRLRESAFARVKLVMESREDVLLIPRDAVLEENARTYVFVVDDGGAAQEPEAGGVEGGQGANEGEKRLYARRTEVQLGLEDGNSVEVQSGLDEGTLVVTMGQKNLKPDAEIRVTTLGDEMAAFGGVTTEEALAAAEAERERIKARTDQAKEEAREQRTEEQRRKRVGAAQ